MRDCLLLALVLLLPLVSFAQPKPSTSPPAPEASVNGKSQAEWRKILKDASSSKADQIAALTALTAVAPSADDLALFSRFVENSHEDVARQALLTLGKFGESAVPHLIRGLNQKNRSVASLSALLLIDLGWKARAASVPLVVALGDDFPNDVRDQVSQHLAAMQHPDTIPLVKPLLNSRDPISRLLAGRVLTRLEAETPAVLEAYRDMLKSEDPQLRLFACGDLSQFGPEANPLFPEMLLLLKDKEALIRRNAINVISKMLHAAPPEAAEALRLLAEKDESRVVRLDAISALFSIRAKAPFEQLLKPLLEEAPDAVRLQACLLSAWLNPEHRVWLKPMMELAEKENLLGARAVNSLGVIGLPAGDAAGVVASHLTEFGLPEVSALSLSRMGTSAKAHLLKLTELAKNAQKSDVRASAAYAITQLTNSPEAQDLLFTMAESTKEEESLAGLRALAMLPDLPKPRYEKLAEKYPGKSRESQLAILQTLLKLQSIDLAKVTARQILREGTAQDRLDVVNLWKLAGAKGVSLNRELEHFLWNDDRNLVASIIELWGVQGPDALASLPALLPRIMVSQEPDSLYSAACETFRLMGIKSEIAKRFLTAQLSHRSAYVRVNAAYALLQLFEDKSHGKILEEGLNSRALRTRAYAAEALMMLNGDPRAMKVLIGLLDDPELNPLQENGLYIALRASQRLGPVARDALPLLKRHTTSSNITIAMIAREAVAAVE